MDVYVFIKSQLATIKKFLDKDDVEGALHHYYSHLHPLIKTIDDPPLVKAIYRMYATLIIAENNLPTPQRTRTKPATNGSTEKKLFQQLKTLDRTKILQQPTKQDTLSTEIKNLLHKKQELLPFLQSLGSKDFRIVQNRKKYNQQYKQKCKKQYPIIDQILTNTFQQEKQTQQ